MTNKNSKTQWVRIFSTKGWALYTIDFLNVKQFYRYFKTKLLDLTC